MDPRHEGHIVSFRRKEFKKTLSVKDGRKKRETNMIEIRKGKRLEGSRKRRMKEHPAVECTGGAGGPSETVDIAPLDVTKWISDAVASIRSGDTVRRKEGLMTIRKIISLEDDDMIPFEMVLSTGIVMDAVTFLDSGDLEEVYQAIWFFTNIASSTYTSVIVEFDGLFERVIMFLQHDDARIRDQAVWCVANVVGDRPEFRDMFYARAEHMAAFMCAMEHANEAEHLNNLAWLVQNLCLGNPRPSIEIVTSFLIPVIGMLLFEDADAGKLRENHEIVNCGIYAIRLLSDKQDEYIQVILDHGILPTVVQFLNHPSPSVVLGSCKILANVASGTTEQTAYIRDGELWDMLYGIMHFKFSAKVRSEIEKEICFFMSNAVIDMTKGDPLFGHLLFHHLISIVPGASSKVVQEASFLIINLIKQAESGVVMELLDHGLMEALKTLIGSPITEARHNGLTSLNFLCKTYPRVISAAEALGVDEMLSEMDGTVDERSQGFVNVLLGVYFDDASDID